MPRKRKQKWKVGDVFTVPLKNQHQVVGQEPDVLNSATCAFYDKCLAPDDARKVCDLDTNHVFAVILCTRDLLDSGSWGVVQSFPVDIDDNLMPYEDLPSSGFVGAKVIGSGIVNEFLNAYYRLVPWDDWKDPEYLDALLVSPDKKPANLVYKKE